MTCLLGCGFVEKSLRVDGGGLVDESLMVMEESFVGGSSVHW